MFTAAHSFDIEQIRSLFPALHQNVYGTPLIYFDNAATTQKPLAVLRSAQHFYEQDNANIHRGIHALATRSTLALEQTRRSVQKLLGAPDVESIVFTSGTTESLNLVAATYGEMALQPGHEVVVSEMEHHANLVPWQRICKRKQAILKAIPIDDEGQLDTTQLDQWITKRTKIVAVGYVSNTLGTINPLKLIIEKAHDQGAVVVVDGAQAVAHLPIDVADLDCDFFAFSAHKLYGLTGLGFLYGKKKWLEAMPPYKTGGAMVQRVTLTEATYQAPPYKFETGTPPLAAIVSFAEAVKFVLSISYLKLAAYEETLLCYALAGLARMPSVQLVGTTHNKVGIVSFNVTGIHHLDVGLFLDAKGIAVRTGHCCTQPLMERLGIEGVVRISFGIYNTVEEIDFFLETLEHLIQKRNFR